MILPNPLGWERVAEEIGAEVADALGDLSFVIEPWVGGRGAPPPSEFYDENALLSTAALIVNAARAGLGLRDGDPELGGPLRTVDLLEPELESVLRRSLDAAPARCQRVLSLKTDARPSRPVGANDAAAMTATIALVARAAARVLTK